MKAIAFAIASALTIFTSAHPRIARSTTYEFYYAYTAGVLVANVTNNEKAHRDTELIGINKMHLIDYNQSRAYRR